MIMPSLKDVGSLVVQTVPESGGKFNLERALYVKRRDKALYVNKLRPKK